MVSWAASAIAKVIVNDRIWTVVDQQRIGLSKTTHLNEAPNQNKPNRSF